MSGQKLKHFDVKCFEGISPQHRAPRQKPRRVPEPETLRRESERLRQQVERLRHQLDEQAEKLVEEQPRIADAEKQGRSQD